MKILIIRNYPSYMSVKNSTYNIQEVGLAKALIRKGHVSDIVFWTDKEVETTELKFDDGKIIHVFYKKGFTRLKNTIFLDCEDLFDNYDILQPCEYNQIESWLLAKKYPDKTIIYHGPYYSDFNKRFNTMCRVFDLLFLDRYRKLNTKFIVKSKLAEEFLINKRIEKSNISTIGVGIDSEALVSKDRQCDDFLYKTLISDSSDLKILYVGRFEERRNINFVLDIFKNIAESNTDARLYMIGAGDDEYMKKTFRYAEGLGIRDRIIWQKKMEQRYLSKVYERADFFLLPTKYEIFGMVLLEAMFYKSVVLTTANGGSSMLINDGYNGFILDESDAKVWAQTIKVINSDPNVKKEIGERAHQMIEQRYTWDSLADKFITAYSNCFFS